MIMRIEGIVNGNFVIFNRDSDGDWCVTVPVNFDGEYIVSVTAYDQAGNFVYSSLLYFAIDLSKLSVQIMPLNYEVEDVNLMKQNNFPAKVLRPIYSSEVLL